MSFLTRILLLTALPVWVPAWVTVCGAARADVLDAVSQGSVRGETQQTNKFLHSFQVSPLAAGSVSAEFRQRQSVQDWLFHADRNLYETQPVREPRVSAVPDSDARTEVHAGNSAVADTEIQPFLLIIPRSGYRGPVSSPVLAIGDRDVIFDLQHPAFRSPLRQVYVDRCCAEFRRYLGESQGRFPAAAATAELSPSVPGVLDGVCSAMRDLQSPGAGLRFQDAALAQLHNQICQPDLAMAGQAFVLRADQLPGKPFRPMASLKNLLQRLQAACLNLKLTTSAKIQDRGDSVFSALPGRISSRWWFLPAGGCCLVLCGLFALRFRQTVH